MQNNIPNPNSQPKAYKHGPSTKNPYLLQVTNLPFGINNDQLRDFVVQNLLITEKTHGLGQYGFIFLQNQQVSAKYKLLGKKILVNKIKMAFRRDEFLGVAAMELEIPDFDVKINFNPNDDDEINDYLRIHPEAGQYVASTQAFLHELLGAISYQLNEALNVNHVELNGKIPFFSRMHPRNVRKFMVKRGSTGKGGKKKNFDDDDDDCVAAPAPAPSRVLQTNFTTANPNLKRKKLSEEFLTIMAEQHNKKHIINTRLANLKRTSSLQNQGAINDLEKSNIRKLENDEILVFFLDFEVAFDEHPSFAVPLEVGIICAALKLKFTNNLNKEIANFQNIRVLDRTLYYFDPMVPPSLQMGLEKSDQPSRMQKIRHALMYEMGSEGPDVLSWVFEEMIHFLSYDNDLDSKNILIYSHDHLTAQKSYNFLFENYSIACNSEMYAPRYDFFGQAFQMNMRNITDLLWVHPSMCRRDVEDMKNKYLSNPRDFPFLYNKDAQCVEHYKMSEYSKKIHCALEDATSLFVLMEAIVMGRGCWDISKIVLAGSRLIPPPDYNAGMTWLSLGGSNPNAQNNIYNPNNIPQSSNGINTTFSSNWRKLNPEQYLIERNLKVDEINTNFHKLWQFLDDLKAEQEASSQNNEQEFQNPKENEIENENLEQPAIPNLNENGEYDQNPFDDQEEQKFNENGYINNNNPVQNKVVKDEIDKGFEEFLQEENNFDKKPVGDGDSDEVDFQKVKKKWTQQDDKYFFGKEE